jgi:general secretion pathway protein A
LRVELVLNHIAVTLTLCVKSTIGGTILTSAAQQVNFFSSCHWPKLNMYTGFFGLSDVPFSIAPNPHFLFMSERHREALAHLTYGLGETGGFVLLTGEVGTGKTTVSRCVLAQLPEHTQVAFILNPTLSSQELLATICDELHIRYRKTGATLKTLTDKIQQKLLKNHEAGVNTVLIIDEAQHLRADVLEQLRLLTNLETHTKKLLQVILIGQPELQKLLQRQDLRQLAQRITARYHLLPLTKVEVSQYIQHRLSVVGCQQALFSSAAITQIHKISRGIPRLINLLCDRALLGAYGANKAQVNAKLIRTAAAEALGEQYLPTAKISKLSSNLMLLVVLVSLLIAVLWWQRGDLVHVAQNTQLSVSEIITPALIEQNRTLSPAVHQLLALWRIELEQQVEDPCQTAQTFSLACYWYKGNLAQLIKLQYPAILKLYDAQGQAFYVTLSADVSKITDNGSMVIPLRVYQQGQAVNKLVSVAWLEQYWHGGALVFWQAPKDHNGQLIAAFSSTVDATLWQWLETQLSAKQHRPTRQVVEFDALLANQLQQFQRSNGLIAEQHGIGSVSQHTLMALANQTKQGMPLFLRNAVTP